MTNSQKASRRDQILQALAQMLEAGPGTKITTASLAKQVGVSEAALYRHFPSKAKMFEGLIEFIESAVFSRINVIVKDGASGTAKCERIIALVLTFAERNPGLSVIMTGEALVGETERLRTRMSQFFERLETQLKQVLRDAEIADGLRTQMPQALAANMMVSFIEGKINQYGRHTFKRKPTENLQTYLDALNRGLFQ